MLDALKITLIALSFSAFVQNTLADENPEIPSAFSIKTHTDCRINIENCKETLKIAIAEEDAKFPMYVSKGTGKIENVIVLLHGTGRNANEYLHDFITHIEGNPVLENMAVVAPHFKQVNDTFEEKELRWKQGWQNSWKYGFNSGAPLEISSYEVIDRLIKDIDEDWHPEKITIVGHSAGGQFVQRYAHGTRITYDINSTLTFVVSNPSSYLYSNNDRMINGSWGKPQDCAEYNSYVYGLENLNPYLSRLEKEDLKENYVENHVIYLMGEEDNLSEDLDDSCEANLQGRDRITRSRIFFSHLNHFFPGHHHKFIPVPGVGHDHIKMFSSKEFLNFLAEDRNESSDSLTIQREGGKDMSGKKPEALYFLNGGGANIDSAFVELLRALRGGDLLILSGKDEPLDYNEYFMELAKEHSIALNSVTTVLIHNRSGSFDSRLLKLITQSEGIFFSGGDQWKYIDRIRNTPALKAINKKLKTDIPFGGTSAGLAILGDVIFTAEKGSVSSDEIMTNPYHEKITLESSMFNIEMLQSILTDTHFVARDRMGRLVSFLARGFSDTKGLIHGLGVDEDTVLVMDKLGKSKVLGSGSVYLLRPNTIPIMGNGQFIWKNIWVNRWHSGTAFSLLDISPPDYLYDVIDGKLYSTQENGDIY